MFGQYPDVYRGIETGTHVEKIFINIWIEDENLNAAMRQDVLDFPISGVYLSLGEENFLVVIFDVRFSLDGRNAFVSQTHPIVGHHQIPARRRHQAKANKIVPNPDQRFFFFPRSEEHTS